MTAFVDTSALYALLDDDDPSHQRAVEGLESLRGTALVTHNYVLVEAAAVVDRRLGATAARDLLTELTRPFRVVWVDEALHRRAASVFVAAATRSVSLVDCVSFEVMRSRGMRTAFAFDRHFAAQGFELVG